jgi:flagellar motor switch protein FliM
MSGAFQQPLQDQAEVSRLKPPQEVKPFTVGHARSLSQSDLSRFKNHSATIVRNVAARLSLFLRTDFGFELAALDAVDHGRYCNETPAPRNLIMFQVEPMAGLCVIDMSKPLTLALVDRMLGGRGFGINPERELKEVEVALLHQTVLLITREYFQYWLPPGSDFRPVIAGRESNPRYLGLGPAQALFYHLKIEASLGDCFGEVEMLLPVDMLAPYVQKLLISADRETNALVTKPVTPPWNPNLGDVPLRTSAVWRNIAVTPRQLLGLKAGDILPLEPERIDSVEIQIQGVTRFSGKLGSLSKKTAIEIIHRIES